MEINEWISTWRKREKIISRKRRMAEEVKPIYKRFTDRYIKYYVSSNIHWLQFMHIRGFLWWGGWYRWFQNHKLYLEDKNNKQRSLYILRRKIKYIVFCLYIYSTVSTICKGVNANSMQLRIYCMRCISWKSAPGAVLEGGRGSKRELLFVPV